MRTQNGGRTRHKVLRSAVTFDLGADGLLRLACKTHKTLDERSAVGPHKPRHLGGAQLEAKDFEKCGDF